MSPKTTELVVLSAAAALAFTAIGGGDPIKGVKTTASGITYLGGGALSVLDIIKPTSPPNPLQEGCTRMPPPIGGVSCGGISPANGQQHLKLDGIK